VTTPPRMLGMTSSPGQRTAAHVDVGAPAEQEVYAGTQDGYAEGDYAEGDEYGEAYEYTEGYAYAEGDEAEYEHTAATPAHAYASEDADGETATHYADSGYEGGAYQEGDAGHEEGYDDEGYEAEPLPEMPAEVEALLAAMADLEDILRLESAAVDMVEPPLPLPEITTHKLNAEAAYRGAIAAVQCLPDGVAGLEPWIREYLADAAQSLADASQENIAAVAAARDAQQRLVDLIIDTVKHTRQSQGGYAHLAQTAASPHQRVAASVPAAVSKVL